MALSQCSSELSTSPFSSSQPPVCVTQSMQPCRLVLNPFLPGVTEVTLAVLYSAAHATSWRKPTPDQHPPTSSDSGCPTTALSTLAHWSNSHIYPTTAERADTCTNTHKHHRGIKHSPGNRLTFYLLLSLPLYWLSNPTCVEHSEHKPF